MFIEQFTEQTACERYRP